MKPMKVRFWGAFSLVLAYGSSSQALVTYYVRNDTTDPILIGLYNIDENNRVLNPYNYAYLLAPKTKTREGQYASLVSHTEPSTVSQQFIFSKSINDMVRTVVQHIDDPLVVWKPVKVQENGMPQRFYKIRPDIGTYSEESGGPNLTIIPVDRPIIGSQSRLKFDLKKEDDVRKADSFLAKIGVDLRADLRAQQVQQRKLVQRLKKEIEKEKKQKNEIVLVRTKLQAFIADAKKKISALRRKPQQPQEPVIPYAQPYPEEPNIPYAAPAGTETTSEEPPPSYEQSLSYPSLYPETQPAVGAHYQIVEPVGAHYQVAEPLEAPQPEIPVAPKVRWVIQGKELEGPEEALGPAVNPEELNKEANRLLEQAKRAANPQQLQSLVQAAEKMQAQVAKVEKQVVTHTDDLQKRAERHRRFSAAQKRASVGIVSDRSPVEGVEVDPFAFMGDQPEEEAVIVH